MPPTVQRSRLPIVSFGLCDHAYIFLGRVMSRRPANNPATEMSSSISSQCIPEALSSTLARLIRRSVKQAGEPRQGHAPKSARPPDRPRSWCRRNGRLRAPAIRLWGQSKKSWDRCGHMRTVKRFSHSCAPRELLIRVTLTSERFRIQKVVWIGLPEGGDGIDGDKNGLSSVPLSIALSIFKYSST